MRQLATALLFLAGLTATAGAAQVRQFPYQAIVDSDDVYVRSGPGRKYYPTDQLSRGGQVTVHRHDPGGWYMIAPPPGSFSWIRAEYVRPVGGDRGVLTTNNVVVRVGSAFDDDSRDVEQIRLSTGDDVRILEERTLQTEQGPLRMYKIEPPPGEYRWILGQALVPVEEVVRSQKDRDPFDVPARAKRPNADAAPALPTDQEPGPESPPKLAIPVPNLADNDAWDSAATAAEAPKTPSRKPTAERPVVRTSPGEAVRATGPSASELENDRSRLERLDDQFRAIVSRETSTWDFADLERGYRRLQDEAAHPAIASQVELRFDALRRYRKIKAEFDDFTRLTSETSQRDAQLLSIQRRFQEHPEDSAPPSSGLPAPVAPQPQPQRQPFPDGQPQPHVPPGIPLHGVQPPGSAPPAASQPGLPAWRPTLPSAPGPVASPRPAHPHPASPPVDRRQQVPSQPLLRVPPPHPQPSLPTGSRPGVHQPAPALPPFDGAGIVQPAATTYPGAPRHVLLAPDGRILAYLHEAQGVNLDRFLGHAVGIYGDRSYRPDLQAELIVVRHLRPVRLTAE